MHRHGFANDFSEWWYYSFTAAAEPRSYDFAIVPKGTVNSWLEGADMSIMYHDGNRRLQDHFDSRRIADRLEEKLTRTRLHRRRQGLHRERHLFLHRHRRRGRPAGLLLQGRRAGLRARDRRRTSWPSPTTTATACSRASAICWSIRNVGLLFIDMHEKPRRLRVNGEAQRLARRSAAGRDGRRAADRAREGARHLPQLPALHPEAAAGRAVDLRAAARHASPSSRPGRASPTSRTTCIRASRRGRVRLCRGGVRQEANLRCKHPFTLSFWSFDSGEISGGKN